VLTAGYVQASAGGVLSVVTEVALSDLGDYTRGAIIRGGAADWEAYAHPAAAGYALVSDATDIVWDQTPAWTGLHLFGAGIQLNTNTSIWCTDNAAPAMRIEDVGGTEYVHVVSTDVQPEFTINPQIADIDFHVHYLGNADGLRIRGSDGQVTLGALTAGYVQSSAGGVLSVTTTVALADLASYTQGDLIYGGGADWADLAHPGAANRVLQSTAAEVGWSAQAVTFPAAGTVPVGSGIANQVAYWSGINTLAGDTGLTYNAATDTLSLANSLTFTGATGINDITVPDNLADALSLEDAGGLTYWQVVSTDAQPIFDVNPSTADIDFRVQGDTDANLIYADASGDNVGIGVADPDTKLEIYKVGTQLKLSGGAADYATFAVAADGALTVTTVDIDAADGDLLLMPDGMVGINTTLPVNNAAGTTFLEVANAGQAMAHIVGYSTTGAVCGTLRVGRSNNATKGTLTVTSSGDTLGEIHFCGVSKAGYDFDNGATIKSIQSAAVSVDYRMPAHLVFETGTAADNPTERMRIEDAGDVVIGNTSASGKLHVDQESTTGAKPVLYLDQADVSEEMIEFNTTIGAGNAIEAVGGKSLTTTHFIKVTLPGALTRYIPCGTIA
jgi:hypothetical protein